MAYCKLSSRVADDKNIMKKKNEEFQRKSCTLLY